MKSVPAVIRLLWILALPGGAGAADDSWPEDDIDANPYQVGADERRFLPADADDGWLHVHNRLSIGVQSLNDGWVQLKQCYANLDAVPAVDVVYRYRRMRGLRVTSTEGIGSATAGDNSVSLSAVEKNARLCVHAEVQILERRSDGSFVMRNGPFHRRFLDGYFPMRVTLDIDYPDDALTFKRAEPLPQTGFSVVQTRGHVHVDTRFTGKLQLLFYFD